MPAGRHGAVDAAPSRPFPVHDRRRPTAADGSTTTLSVSAGRAPVDHRLTRVTNPGRSAQRSSEVLATTARGGSAQSGSAEWSTSVGSASPSSARSVRPGPVGGRRSRSPAAVFGREDGPGERPHPSTHDKPLERACRTASRRGGERPATTWGHRGARTCLRADIMRGAATHGRVPGAPSCRHRAQPSARTASTLAGAALPGMATVTQRPACARRRPPSAALPRSRWAPPASASGGLGGRRPAHLERPGRSSAGPRHRTGGSPAHRRPSSKGQAYQDHHVPQFFLHARRVVGPQPRRCLHARHYSCTFTVPTTRDHRRPEVRRIPFCSIQACRYPPFDILLVDLPVIDCGGGQLP